MTDIPITVSAPGATKAAAELRGVATATERAGQAAGTNATQQTRQAQALERSAAAAKKANNEMRAAITRGAAAGGMGGGISGAIGITGMSGPLMALSAGVVVAGLAVTAFATSMERATETAKRVAKTEADISSIVNAARVAADRAGVTAVQNDGDNIKSIVRAGGDTLLNKVLERESKKGEMLGAAAAFANAGVTDPKRMDSLLRSVGKVRNLYGGNVTNIAKQTVENGLLGITDPHDQRAAMASVVSNRMVSKEMFKQQEEASWESPAIGEIVSGERMTGQLHAKTIERGLVPGTAGKVFMPELAEISNPGGRARSDVVAKMNAAAAILQVGAKNQNVLVEIFKDLAFVFGGEGSEAGKLFRLQNEINNIAGIPVQ